MLVVHPASSCDVCLESYTARPHNTPCSITCGHVFCFNCLKSLRQQICPLCRSPFDFSELRRLHVDRSDSQYSLSHRSPSPREQQQAELLPDNALGLVDDIPHATRLQRKISDLVLRSSFTNGVRERGIREFIQEIHAFLSAEPQELHTDLRAEFLLLYRFTELQARYQQLETASFDLRTESSRSKQAITDWERKYQDLQRSRARDQDSARIVEASLRERLRIEELEWQRKYDYVSEQCAQLRDELDRLRLPSSSGYIASYHPRRSTSDTQLSHLVAEGSSPYGTYSERKDASLKSKDETDIFSHLDPNLLHLSPVPPKINLSNSRESTDSDDDVSMQKSRQRAPESPSRTNSTSSNISRASESAAALKAYSASTPVQGMMNRHRSDSYPTRGAEKTKAYYFESQREVSSSVPNSYMYRAASPTRALFPTTPPSSLAQFEDVMQAMCPYPVVDKPGPAPDPRFARISSDVNRLSNSGTEKQTSRPLMPRSTSFQPSHSSENSASSPSVFSQNTLAARRAHPPIMVQTSALSATRFQRGTASSPQTPTHNQAQSQTTDVISPIQRTPPRPVLPHMHSYVSLYSPQTKPASPKETRTAVRGSLPRRGSLSSASAAAQAASSGSSGVIPASSLGSRRSRGQGIFGGQDSDA